MTDSLNPISSVQTLPQEKQTTSTHKRFFLLRFLDPFVAAMKNGWSTLKRWAISLVTSSPEADRVDGVARDTLGIEPASLDFQPVQDLCSLEILTPSMSGSQREKLRLNNGMEVLLIHDPNAEKSAAALAVGAGSLDNPPEALGMAHFLEHMLFMGTEKYPGENDYDVFLQEHGGTYNAYTAGDHTNYMFSIDSDAFEGGVDRFAQFFIHPLFAPGGVEREMQAVDKEFSKNKPNDTWRRYHVLTEIANPDHPTSRFSTGNYETLAEISQDELKAWYRANYSANQMKLVLYSTQPIEEMRRWAVEKFSAVENHDRPERADMGPEFTEATLGKMVAIEPFTDKRRLDLSWELDRSFADQIEARSEAVLSHILGDEGEGSLLQQLIQEGLALGLSAGGSVIGSDNPSFEIGIKLTERGLQEKETVIERVYQAIARLREGIPASLVEQFQAADRFAYQFQDRQDAFNYVAGGASGLLKEDLASYPERLTMISEYDPDATQRMLGQLTPRNCVTCVTGHAEDMGLATDRTERWMGVSYGVHEIGDSLLERWENAEPHERITLPPANPYIPENFTVKYSGEPSKELPEPTHVRSDETAEIYFAQDTKFLSPKVSWDFTVRSAEMAERTPEKLVLQSLYTRILKEALKHVTYPAGSVGLDAAVTPAKYGLHIGLEGFSDKALCLFEDILGKIVGFRPTVEQFTTHLAALQQDLGNAKKAPLYQQAFRWLEESLSEGAISLARQEDAAQSVTFEQFQEFCDSFLSSTHTQAMLYGNMDAADAQRVDVVLHHALTGDAAEAGNFTKTKAMRMDPSARARFSTREVAEVPDHSTLLAIEVGEDTPSTWALSSLLAKALHEPFFSKLRSKQQTGYICAARNRRIGDTYYNWFLVESNTYSAEELHYRFELFIANYVRRLKEGKQMTEEAFASLKRGVLSDLDAQTKELGDAAEVLHTQAFRYDGDFTVMQQRAEALRNLSYEEFVSKTVESLDRKQNTRRRAFRVEGLLDPNEDVSYQSA